MSPLVFYGTDVLLYAVSTAPEEIAKRTIATRLLAEPDWVWSAQAMQEFYVNAIRPGRGGGPAALCAEDAQELLVLLTADHACQPVTDEVVLRAIDLQRRFPLSYWDAALLASAAAAGAEFVFSEDLSDGCDYGGIVVMNPFRIP